MPTSRGPHAGFYINIETPFVQIHGEGGRFIPGAQKELYAQNRTLAIRMKEKVATVINGSIVRQHVKSGRLVKATLGAENSTFGFDHVGVGNPEYLDRSIAKYWRTIEEGSAKAWTKRSFLSLELQGIWGLNIGEGRWNISSRSNEWASLGGKAEKAATTSRNMPTGRIGQEMYMPFRKGRGGGPSGLPVFHPKREIQPMGAYKLVANEPQYIEIALRANDAYIKKLLDRPISPPNFRGGAWDRLA
jgi:hypothetical protein